MRGWQLNVALIGIAVAAIGFGCAGIRSKSENMVVQKGESATREFSAAKERLWDASKGTVRGMGFTYHPDQVTMQIETEPLLWQPAGADFGKIKNYRASVSVLVKERSVSVEALWGKKAEQSLVRDESSSAAEQKLLDAWFDEFQKQLAAGPKRTDKVPGVEDLKPSTAEPQVQPQPQEGKPAIAEETTESRDEAAKRVKYIGKEDVIVLDAPKITPSSAAPGGRVVQELRYTLLSPQRGRIIAIQETVVISDGQGLLVPLVKNKKLNKEQGTHLSVLRFVLPKDIPPGEYRLQTTITAGQQKTSTSATFQVAR